MYLVVLTQQSSLAGIYNFRLQRLHAEAQLDIFHMRNQ